MTESNPVNLPHIILVFLGFLLFSGMVGWAVILGRWCFRLPVLPASPRRRVPWTGGDVLLIVLTYLFTTIIALGVIHYFVDLPEVEPAAVAADAPDASHEVIKMIGEGLSTGQTWVLAFAAVMVVLFAPIFEEFFFRVVLQGWLESVDAGFRFAGFRFARIPFGLIPILATSLFFASLHFRTAGPEPGFHHRVVALAINLLVGAFVMAAAIVHLTTARGATAADLGWDRKTFLADVRLGLGSACVILGPLYVIQFVAISLLPKTVAADPIAIFALSVALGFLYLRTHRVTPGVTLHMCLNALSLLMAVLVLMGGR